MIEVPKLDAALRQAGLIRRGIAPLSREEQSWLGGGHVLLIGQEDDIFWPLVQASPFAHADDPMDAYAKEALEQIGDAFGLRAVFPFERYQNGYAPFFDWALRSGAAFKSPVGMLVHHEMGLLISYRGGLIVPDWEGEAGRYERPCDRCADRPCLAACPVAALGDAGYDVDGCRAELRGDDRGNCMNHGCAARRACPISPSSIGGHMPHVMGRFRDA